jgi:hypothetical protein
MTCIARVLDASISPMQKWPCLHLGGYHCLKKTVKYPTTTGLILAAFLGIGPTDISESLGL